jgi:hypothetical protein
MNSSPRFNRLDRVLAGLWWWRLRRSQAERKISHAPEQEHEIEQAYREWKRYEFACALGRPTERKVAKAVEEAAKDGADWEALSLVVSNRDVSERNGELQYRTGNWLKATGYLASAVCLVGSGMFATLLALAPMPLISKLIAFAVIFSVLVAGAYIFELYTSRPLAAANKLRANSEQAMQAKIVALHAHPGFRAVAKEEDLK